MATKLKGLEISKVDFVDQGANPDAHIRLFKRKEKLDMDDSESILKRLLLAITKLAAGKQEDICDIEKGNSATFTDKMSEVMTRKVADEIWDMCYALQSSLCSVLTDEELDVQKSQDAMIQSVSEFADTVRSCVGRWTQERKEAQVEQLEEVKPPDDLTVKYIDSQGATEVGITTQGQEGIKKGDQEDMRIDTSKMTSAELMFYQEIVKRFGEKEKEVDKAEPFLPGKKPDKADAGVDAEEDTKEQETDAKKKKDIPCAKSMEVSNNTDDIYKGIHPAVLAELESFRKFKEDAQDKELVELAKRFELIGKKPDELVPLFKSLKAAGGSAFMDMLTVLDASVAAVEKSGAFSELGRSGVAGGNETGTVAKAKAKIAEIRKSNPGLSEAQAMDLVLLEDEQIRAEMDQ